MSQISFDYNSVIKAASDFDNVASMIKSQTCKEADEIISSIDASWSGESEKLFVNYFAAVRDLLKVQGDYLNKYSDYLRESARKMQQAEQAAADAAKKI